MDVTRKSRRQLRLQGALFVVVFLTIMGLLGWLSTRYNITADWTAGNRNSLTESSEQLLATLSGPVTITAFAREDKLLRKGLAELVSRYQRHKTNITLNFVNPDTNPDEVRRQGITLDGEMVVNYQGRSEKLQTPSEQGLTNLLQRLARSKERWITFLEGHGERKPGGSANHDLGNFGAELERKGIKIESINLAVTTSIPENTAALVIAGPQTDLLPGEVAEIQKYLAAGGNLLWLTDPEAESGLQPVAEELGISFLPGVVVDANTQLLGIDDPAFALVADYPPHPVTNELDTLTLFPRAVALEHGGGDWRAQPMLETLPRSWTETGPLSGTIRVDADLGERPGPLMIGLGLTRARSTTSDSETSDAQTDTGEQRVAVIGDGDFLANAYLGNGGNLALGMNLINWLANDDRFIAIKPVAAVDAGLQLTALSSTLISAGFLVIIPLGLVGTGITIWLRRRKR
jgi:ABC-type uncharacterized transport system involved in gliding motility auxiliary subunit